jgi:hypothetical protein
MVALKQWGDEYVNDGAPPATLHDKTSGELVRIELRTDSGPVEAHEIEPRATMS